MLKRTGSEPSPAQVLKSLLLKIQFNLCLCGFSPGSSSFLPQSKNVHMGQTWNLKLSLSVNVNGSLSPGCLWRYITYVTECILNLLELTVWELFTLNINFIL